jgi:predicted dehydrogenase
MHFFESMTNISRLKVLVSGFGSIGQRHMRNLHMLGVTDLAYADTKPDAEVVPGIENELSLIGFSSLEEALKEFKPEVVFVCSPTQFHIPQALEAAKAGCHLFIEKPLSHSQEGIKELSQIVEEKNLITMVACNMRYHPGAKQVKKWLDEGEIGKPSVARVFSGSHLPNWRRKTPYKESYSADPEQGGVLLDCIHEIDLALWYFGSAKLESSTTISADGIGLKVDGLSELLLRHSSGLVSSVHLNFVQHTYRRGCHIFGSEGVIHWTVSVPPGLEKSEEDRARVDLFGADGLRKEQVLEDPAWDRNQMYLEETRDFLQAVDAGTPSAAPLSVGKEALDIVLAARQALKE